MRSKFVYAVCLELCLVHSKFSVKWHFLLFLEALVTYINDRIEIWSPRSLVPEPKDHHYALLSTLEDLLDHIPGVSHITSYTSLLTTQCKVYLFWAHSKLVSFFIHGCHLLTLFLNLKILHTIFHGGFHNTFSHIAT